MMIFIIHLCVAIITIKSHSIDRLHLKLYPYCGSMDYENINHETSGRAVNTWNNSKEFYRWLVLIERRNYQTNKPRTFNVRPCTGSIITDR